jgi:hypothetical protein
MGACVGEREEEGEGEDKMNRLLRCGEVFCQRVVLIVRNVMSLDS